MPNLLGRSDLTSSSWRHIMDTLVRILVMLIAIAVGVSLYCIVVVSYNVQQLTIQNNDLNRRNIQIGQRLIDCTTEGHTCYDQSNQRTNRVIISLNDVTKAAAVCADKPGTIGIKEMDDCIQTELSKEGK